MFINQVKKVGDYVTRYDNERHEGRIEAIFNTSPQAVSIEWMKASTFRVLWNNGWREDCDYDELIVRR